MTVFDRLRQLEANTTPGPWLPQGGFIYVGSDKPETLASYVGRDEDADFIVAARNLWGPLVAVAEAAAILCVLIDEPAAKGLMGDDWQSYYQGASLGLAEKLAALERAVTEQP